MKSFLTFLFLISLSSLAFAENQEGDIPCHQFTELIQEKIREGFARSQANADNSGQCSPDTFGRAAQTTVAQCHQLVHSADEYCRSIRYEQAQLAGGGMGKQGRHASTALQEKAEKFDTESIECGKKLNMIPQECKRLSAEFHNQLLSAKCNAEQFKEQEERSIEKATPMIIKFCQTANYYKNAQADHFRMMNTIAETNNTIIDTTQGHNLPPTSE